MKKIFLVVLNWNGAKDTIECLDSIDHLRIKNFKPYVVVVDNGSVDNSKEVLSDIKLKNASYKLIVRQDQRIPICAHASCILI